MAREDSYFKPGQSGNFNGRPRGSRNKLSEAALAALCADFEAGGAAAIERCRQEDPTGYLRVVASLLPKQIEKVPTDPLDQMSDAELDAFLAWLEAHRAGAEPAEAVGRILRGDDRHEASSKTQPDEFFLPRHPVAQ